MNNVHPAHRTGPTFSRSITRRKQLAQAIRNDLDAYRRRASDVGDQVAARDRCLHRIDAKFHALLELEGFDR